MKKLSLIAFMIINAICIGQKDSIHIFKYEDDMDDKVYYFPNYKLVVADDRKGIGITAFLSDDGKEIQNLKVKAIGLSDCCENDELIFLFENGEKFIAKSFSEFNCKGESYYDFSKKELFATSKLIKVRYTNGRDMTSYTKEVDPIYQEYFIKVLGAIKNGDIRITKK